MKAILCIPPPVSPDHPLLGIASISTVISSRGFEVEVLDLNAALASSPDISSRYWRKEGFDAWARREFQISVGPILERLIEEHLSGIESLEIFGLHVSSASREMASQIAMYVKKCYPQSLIIAGGPEFFDQPDLIEGSKIYDVVFLGEAEVSLAHWIDDGGFRRRGNRTNLISGELMELDDLPIPFYGHFPMSFYSRPGVLPMETSRGCVNRCAFCDDSRMWKRYRRKSNQRIKSELLSIRSANACQVSFCDSMLNPTKKLFHVLLQTLEECGLTWDGMIQAKEIDYKTAKLVRQSKCAGVFIGIESFSKPFLHLLNKEHSAIHGQQALECLGAEGVKASMGLIIAGPPLQSRKEFEYDLKILEQMASALSSVAINPLCIPAGTNLAKKGSSLGIKGLGSRLSWKFWHAGRELEDIRSRFQWCREAAQLLNKCGVSLGANYQEFDSYILEQLRDAEMYFQSM